MTSRCGEDVEDQTSESFGARAVEGLALGPGFSAADEEVADGQVFEFGSFTLRPGQRQLLLGGQPIQLGNRALDILCLLIERAGEIVSKEDILARVWPNTHVAEGNLRVHLAGLRRTLGDTHGNPRFIVNVPNRGYGFVAPVQRASTDSGRDTSRAAGGRSTRPTFPTLHSRLIGRAQAEASLRKQIIEHRLVTLVGAGGVGKTTLAISLVTGLLAETLSSDWREAYFVDLGSTTDEKLVPSAVATALGIPPVGADSVPSLVARINDRELLVVIDSCEHLVGAVAQLVEAMLQGAPRVRILATSREPLRIEGEWIHHLQPLLMPPVGVAGLSVKEAITFPAIELFIERARGRSESFTPTDDDVSYVVEICRRLDGIPLALELAAGRIDVFGLRGLATALASKFAVLSKGRRTALPRHQALHATLDWSFNLLGPHGQVLLQRLSVFASTFTLDAATAVAAWGELDGDDVVDGVSDLVSQSMISADTRHADASFRLLETTRSYAREILAGGSEASTMARRHASYCIRSLEEAQSSGRQQAKTRGNGSPEGLIDDVRSALAWAFSKDGDADLGIDLAVQSVPLMHQRALLAECERWADLALSAMNDNDQKSTRSLTLLEARAMSSMFTHGNSDEVKSALENSLALSQALGDRRRELRLLTGLSIFATRTGDFRWALSIAKRGVAIGADAGGKAELAVGDVLIGVAHSWLGNQSAAQHHLERGLKVAAEYDTGDIDVFGYNQRIRGLSALARTLWLRGLPDQAAEVALMASQDGNARDKPIDFCFSCIYTAPVFFWLGDLAQAERQIAQLRACAEKFALAPYRATGDALQGELLFRQGDAAAGIPLLRRAIVALSESRTLSLVAGFSRTLAEALASTGEFVEALTTVRSTIRRAVAVGGTFELPDLLRAEAQILLSFPDTDLATAERSLKQSIKYAKQQTALSWELRSSMLLARVWQSQGRAADARPMLDNLLRQFREGFSTADLISARALLDQHDASIAGKRTPG